MAFSDTSISPAPQWEQFLSPHFRGNAGAITDILSMVGSSDVITFSGGFPAPEAFPTESLRSIVAELIASTASSALQYSPTHGLAESKEAIAGFITDKQNHYANPADVLVTSGGMEGLSLLSRVLLKKGDRVAVEAPTYLGALSAFVNMDAQIDGLHTDHEGIDVDLLEESLQQGTQPPRLLYTIPDHQNPLGVSLSLERRHRLIEICRRYGILIAEDVAYRELGFEGTALPSLWSLDKEIVLQVGTFSKIMFPGNRLGWAVGPKAVVDAMATAKQISDQCASAFGQKIMSRLLVGGGFDEHLNRIRKIYSSREEAMQKALKESMPKAATWTKPKGGFFVFVTLPQSINTVSLLEQAKALGVAYVPGAPFYSGHNGLNQMRLAFSAVTEEKIATGIARLGELITEKIS